MLRYLKKKRVQNITKKKKKKKYLNCNGGIRTLGPFIAANFAISFSCEVLSTAPSSEIFIATVVTGTEREEGLTVCPELPIFTAS
jgi:hypothetical protein